MAGQILQAVCGTDQSWTQTLIQYNGLVASGEYTSAATFTVSLWDGARTLALSPGLSAAWIDAANGSYTLTVPAASSASLAAGTYRVLVEITSGGMKKPAFDGAIEFRIRPGSQTVPTSYTTFEVMVELYSVLPNLQSLAADQTGFAYQQHQAKADFDLWLIERYNPQPGYNKRRTAGVYDPSAGLDVPDFVTIPPSEAVLRTALAAGGLVLTEPDSTVVSEINARLAIARVLDKQVGGDRRSNAYAQDAMNMKAVAYEMMARYRAFIDTNADTVAEVLIDRDCIFLV